MFDYSESISAKLNHINAQRISPGGLTMMRKRLWKFLFLAAALEAAVSTSWLAGSRGQSPSLRPGDPAPPLDLEAILQASPKASASWDKLRGNAVVLEFWATWCGPCRDAIPHFNELADRYKNKRILFISITDEDEWRIRNFLKVTPIKGWIGLDRDRSAHKAYGVGMIPQTVLIDRTGRLAAFLQPGELTARVLDDMLAGRPLAPPSAPPTSAPQPQTAKAPAQADQAPSLAELLIRPAPPSSSMSFSGGVFQARGMALKALLAQAYDVSRVTVLIDGAKGSETYQVIVRVPPVRSEDLRPLLRQGLEAALGINARRETRETDVLVLSSMENRMPILRAGQSRTENPVLSDEGQISGTSMSLPTFCLILQDALDRIVVDETHRDGLFDVALYWNVKNSDSIFDEVRDQLGLELRPARRPVEFLICGLNPGPSKAL
jgi:uncharacterized protein (TIGR03435 family)